MITNIMNYIIESGGDLPVKKAIVGLGPSSHTLTNGGSQCAPPKLHNTLDGIDSNAMCGVAIVFAFKGQGAHARSSLASNRSGPKYTTFWLVIFPINGIY